MYEEHRICTIIKIYFRTSVLIKCNCGKWGYIIKNGSSYTIKHCDSTYCTISNFPEKTKKIIRDEHTKYMRKRLEVVKDEIRHGNKRSISDGVSYSDNKTWTRFDTRKMPELWKMGKNPNQRAAYNRSHT